jgi:hypothetical protein
VSAASPQLFSARIIAGWLAAAALAGALSFGLMMRDTARTHHPDEAGPTVYSRSAIGYATLYHTLQDLGVSVSEGTSLSGPPLSTSVVVIAEPNRDDEVLAHVRGVLSTAPAVLLVLPKRRGSPDQRQPGRLRSTELLPVAEAERILALVDPGATLSREIGATSWSMRPPVTSASPDVRFPQLAHSWRMRPFVSAQGGILAGELRVGTNRIVVVTDPDLFENHGLLRGNNALIAVSLIRDLRGRGRGPVVFDEAAHGYISSNFGALRVLFEFPFVLVTVQLAIATGLLFWSAAARFGAPSSRAPSLGLGKQSLIESGSRLFASAAQPRFLADSYRDAVLRETTQRLHAPRSLSGDELVAWLERTGRPAPPPATAQSDAVAAVVSARALYHWRNDVLDESG